MTAQPHPGAEDPYRPSDLDPRAAARLSAPLPPALAGRPVDPRRRLPVPYVNVHDRKGVEVTDFTAINADRSLHAGQQRLCGLCGTALGYWISFLGGPNTIRFRAFSDPPAHPACSLAALGLCPHIALAHARRALPGRLHADTQVPVGFHDAKPDQWCLGITRGYQVRVDRGSVIFHAAPFKSVHRWHYDTTGRLVPVPGSPPVPERALTDTTFHCER